MRTQALNLLKLLVPALLALGFNQSSKKNAGWKQYAVYFYDANYYYIIEEVTTQVPGVDYICISVEGSICMVSTFLAPDAYGRIPISYGWPVNSNSEYMPMEY